jgi:hydroxyacylglutathione hydrolase
MTLQIEQFMCRSDNFGVLAHDPESGETVVIDAPEEAPILAAIERTGWKPDRLLITHHHGDHVAANEALKARFGLAILGPEAERDRIPGLDRGVSDGERLRLCGEEVVVIATPGHTLGHVVYHFTGSGVLFAADTLFSLGCGRVIEGTMAQMHASLERLKALPPETVIHCGHEYTSANAAFALSVDPDNPALRQRAAEVEAARAAGRPTLPTTLAAELAANPFLRAHDPAIRARLQMEDASDGEIFAELRRRKDAFRG